MNRLHVGVGVVGLWLLSTAALAQDEAQVATTAPTDSAPLAEPAPASIPMGSIKDASPKERPVGVSVMAWLPWWYGLGIGGKAGVEIPVAHDGFLPSVNDSFSIEPSLSVASVDHGLLLYDVPTLHVLPAVAGIWSFHFSEELRVYGALSLGYGIVSYDEADYDGAGFNYVYTELNAGLGYKLADALALRAEIGWHGLRGGLQLLF
jgi:hypothetical protein